MIKVPEADEERAALAAPDAAMAALDDVYQRLLAAYGPQHWWPARTPLEVVVGAILTQAAAWSNVEKAIANLEAAGALSLAGLRTLAEDDLARLVYPAGYYNAKARKLRAFVEHLHQNYGGRLEALFARPLPELRDELLSIHGIGPETADSIILYAAKQPTFVVDAYTYRLLERLRLGPARSNYEETRRYFLQRLPADVQVYGEFHALIVTHAKRACRRRQPACGGCCLREVCPSREAFLSA